MDVLQSLLLDRQNEEAFAKKKCDYTIPGRSGSETLYTEGPKGSPRPAGVI